MRSTLPRVLMAVLALTVLALTTGAVCRGNGDGETTEPGNGDPSPGITITVGSGTTSTYSWTGGGVFTLTVQCTQSGQPVWQIISDSGGDTIESPVTHGTVPSGAIEAVSIEPELSEDDPYRVSVIRTTEEFGFTDFTP